LENSASAEYYDVGVSHFAFVSGDQSGSGRFINKDGSEQDTFTNWTSANSVAIGSIILLDPLFDEASIVADGTTINDRLFQSIGSVTHDYQLGTQYASTRALVEIPVFSNQFFDDPANGVFPGPDNSMKIHLDPTLTAHSWAPNPVGRRPLGNSPLDSSVMGPYHKRWMDDSVRPAVSVVDIDYNNKNVTIEPGASGELSTSFPIDETNDRFFRTYSNLLGSGDNMILYRRVFLPDGEWALVYYTPSSGESNHNYLNIDSSTVSKNFWESITIGSLLTTGPQIYLSGTPLSDDLSLDSATNEFRRPYYYDRANVQTQGGNIDYGLRQYVSAVEFKEGPIANPQH